MRKILITGEAQAQNFDYRRSSRRGEAQEQSDCRAREHTRITVEQEVYNVCNVPYILYTSSTHAYVPRRIYYTPLPLPLPRSRVLQAYVLYTNLVYTPLPLPRSRVSQAAPSSGTCSSCPPLFLLRFCFSSPPESTSSSSWFSNRYVG